MYAQVRNSMNYHSSIQVSFSKIVLSDGVLYRFNGF